MTRSEPATSAYDDDFFTWTQDQAAALRKLGVRDDIDVEHLAGEIADLGKRDLREVESFLRLLIAHLLKLEANPQSPSVSHWRAEARTFSQSAADAFTPGMRHLIDIAKLWRSATARLARNAEDLHLAPPLDRETFPFQLDDLLSDTFDPDAALSRMADELRR